jgi:heat shock protein HslJ
MRALRTLAAAGLTVSLLAIPVTAAAQDAAPAEASVPLARLPSDVLPLQGTPWRLAAYRHRDRDGAPGPEVAAFIQFGPSVYEGSGGCSRIRGQYGTVGAALEVKPRQLDGRTCAEQIAVVQEAVEAGLRKTASYEVVPGATRADDQLVLRSADGEEVLRYGLDDVARLDWAEWRLASYTVDGQPVPSSTEMPAVMTFEPDEDAYYKRRQSGRLSGSSGCNGVVARFFRSADVLSFSELERTGAPCTPALAAQEEAIVAVLDATSLSLELPYDRLRLTSADSGEELEFVSQTPLEGSTWIVDGRIGGTRTDARVTLRLEDGAASGEGPCGAYGASYATDGVFITFRDVQGARDEDCSESKAEKALLDALRGAVTVARTPDRLDLLDARAVKVLRFGRPFAP